MSDAPTPERFREAMSRFATGLTVVTCRTAGLDHAMTANSFVSVSLDPLLVLFSVERATRFYDAVSTTDAWAVTILPESAVAEARWFATPGRGLEHQFDGLAHHRGARSGALLLDDSLAALECRTWEVVRAGDHDLVIGEVLGIELPPDLGNPLLYHCRSYRGLGPEVG